MKINKMQFGLLVVIMFSIVTFCDVTIIADLSSTTEVRPSSMHIESQYSSHDSIVIISNQDFVDQGWDGNGSKNNPYMIQDLNITSDDRCISISSTDVYFKIIDCFFSYETEQNQGIGVSLEASHNGIIENCDFVGLFYGVYLRHSDNNIIAFNEIDAAGYASINLYESEGCEVFNNSIGEIGNMGINADTVVDVLFANNSFHNEFYGLHLVDSINCTLLNNKFEKVGLWIRGTEREHFLSNTLESNTVGTKPISVLTNRSSEILDASSFGQLFLFNSNNCIVENAIFDYRNVGVSLALCNNCIVRDLNSVYNAICLVELQVCFNVKVTGCSISESHNAGFRFLNTLDCSLTECNTGSSPSNTVFGIEIYNTKNTTIAQNAFQAAGVSGSDNTDCSIIDNDIEGRINVGNSGMHFSNSHNFTLKDNDLHELDTGIVFGWGSTNGTFINNSIHDNRRYGIELGETCEGFRIYDNSFWYNDLGNAIDDGNSNYWDDGINIGNQWDDYNGTGVYNISGLAGSVDHFPKADPYHTRTISTTTTTNQTTVGTGDVSVMLVILGISGVGVVVIFIILSKKR